MRQRKSTVLVESSNVGQSKKLSETFGVRLTVPLSGPELCLQRCMVMVGGTAGAELVVLLGGLKALAAIHQSNHWLCSGETAYSDHLLFERLYNDLLPAIDALAEKIVGKFSGASINCNMLTKLQLELQQEFGCTDSIETSTNLSVVMTSQADCARTSCDAAVSFLLLMNACVKSIQSFTGMSRGVDNQLADIEDMVENHVYLLNQRCGVR